MVCISEPNRYQRPKETKKGFWYKRLSLTRFRDLLSDPTNRHDLLTKKGTQPWTKGLKGIGLPDCLCGKCVVYGIFAVHVHLQCVYIFSVCSSSLNTYSLLTKTVWSFVKTTPLSLERNKGAGGWMFV